jgi:hypothetical protein
MEVLYSINANTEIKPINVNRNYDSYDGYIDYLQRALANSMQVPMEYIFGNTVRGVSICSTQSSAQRDYVYVNNGRAMGKSEAVMETIRGVSGNFVVIDELSHLYPNQLRTIPSVRRHKTRVEDLEQLVLREVERRQDYYVTGTEPILP